jgi:hypothetical protein
VEFTVVAVTSEDIRPTVLVAGYRGTLFVAKLIESGILPRRIVSYHQIGDQSASFNRLAALARAHGLDVEDSRYPGIDSNLDWLVLAVGWQFILRDGLAQCVVLHDSLLPLNRGFSPTVTALLQGSATLSVSAVRPNDGTDPAPSVTAASSSSPPELRCKQRWTTSQWPPSILRSKLCIEPPAAR